MEGKSAVRSADKPSARTDGKPAPVPTDGKAPRSRAASSAGRALSQDEIGNVAGEVWHLLASQGDQTVAALKKSVDAPADLVLAAVGWLAREGKLDFVTSGRSLKLSLR